MTNRILFLSQLYSAFSLIFIFSFSGCTTLPMSIFKKNEIQQESADHPVIDVVGIWQTADGQDTNHLPCRGFGGQILFFAAGHKTPVMVHGDVTVYLFDDVGTQQEQTKPYHVYNFKSDEWNSFFRDSTLGHCYQLFVPYTRPGGKEADCSLRIKYTPQNGMPIYSKVATVNIRGLKHEKRASTNKIPKTDTAQEQTQADSNIKQASHEQSTPLTKEEILNKRFDQHLISTEKTTTREGQQQRLDKLKQFLEKMDPDPGSFKQEYTISHSRKTPSLSSFSKEPESNSQTIIQEPDVEADTNQSKIKDILGLE